MFIRFLREDFFAFIFFLIFTLIICFNIVFKGEVLFTGDNFDLLFPQKEFWVSEIHQGRIPFWNPYILSGSPYLADINLGTLAPTNLIYLIVKPVERAASYLFVLEFFLIGFFTYLCVRNYNLSYLSSVISGITFMCSGVMLTYITNLAIFNVVFYLPLLVFLLEKAIDKKSWRILLLAVIVYSFQILSGHAQLSFYSGLFLAFLILLRKKENWKIKLIILAVLFSFSLGLAAVQLIPFWEFAKNTPRVGQGYQWATIGSLNFPDLIKFVIPKFAWNFVLWSDFSSKVSLGYIGVVPFLLFLGGFFSKNPNFQKFKIIALISLVLSLGRNTPFYKLAYYLIPGLSFLRIPSQFITLYSFSAAIISGLGFEKLVEISSRINLPKKIYCLSVFTSLFIAFLLLIFSVFLINNIVIFGQFYKSGVWFINTLFMFVIIFLFVFSVCLLKAGKLFLGRTLIICLITVDLFLTAKVVILTAPFTSFNISKVIDNNLNKEEHEFKIYTIPPKLKSEKPLFSPDIEEKFAREKKEILLPNQNIAQKLISLDGYASMAITSYLNQFTNASETITGLGFLEIKDINFKKHGVRYIISEKEVEDFTDNPEFLLIRNEKPYIYQIKESPPRYFLQDVGKVKLIEENSQEKIFEVETPNNNRLILLEVNYPGWKAYLDSQSLPITLVEDIYQAIDIPLGKHKIKFIFKPESFKYGLIISSISFIFLIYLFYRGKKFNV